MEAMTGRGEAVVITSSVKNKRREDSLIDNLEHGNEATAAVHRRNKEMGREVTQRTLEHPHDAKLTGTLGLLSSFIIWRRVFYWELNHS